MTEAEPRGRCSRLYRVLGRFGRPTNRRSPGGE